MLTLVTGARPLLRWAAAFPAERAAADLSW